jgi:multidrug transporter EmrE-like cation transporter
LVIFITLVAALIASFSQILFKRNMGSKGYSVLGVVRLMLTNKKILAGLAGYILSLVIYLFALDHAPLSVVYPLFASTFIFIALLSNAMLKERLSKTRLAGIGVIFVGIVVIALTI